jgi:hypothetical protein
MIACFHIGNAQPGWHHYEVDVLNIETREPATVYAWAEGPTVACENAVDFMDERQGGDWVMTEWQEAMS